MKRLEIALQDNRLSAIGVYNKLNGDIEKIIILPDDENDLEYWEIFMDANKRYDLLGSLKANDFNIIDRIHLNDVLSNNPLLRFVSPDIEESEEITVDPSANTPFWNGKGTIPYLFKRYDVVTFEDGEKVVVLATTLYKGKEYVFVQEVLPDESDVVENYKIMVVHFEDGTLQKVSNPNILADVAPIFTELLENLT